MKKWQKVFSVLLLSCSALTLSACKNDTDQVKNTTPATTKNTDIKQGQPKEHPTIQAELTAPPFVPPPVNRDYEAKVVVNMRTIEKTMMIDPANEVQYKFWTFDGTVPGSFIRVREGDELEFHLTNDSSSAMPHNIDLHAVTGPGGGAKASLAQPGETTIFNAKMLSPGLYVYHCATSHVTHHIASGMYGLILVEPKEGLPKVDKEIYVMQGDFYMTGAFGKKAINDFNMEKAVLEHPDYVIFNGSVGSMMGEKAIKAKVGDTVRVYFGVGGPNLTSSFHIIGEIFDRVYMESGSLINNNVQTTMVPAGGATMVEFKLDVPGDYLMVDHSLARAFNKGAIGVILAEGNPNPSIFAAQAKSEAHSGDGHSTSKNAPAAAAVPELSKADKIKVGQGIYTNTCQACHQANGNGVTGAFPPLAKSDYLKGDKNRLIDTVLFGQSGAMKVNNISFNGAMPVQKLNDNDVASVLTYVLNNWGNAGGEVKAADVLKRRKDGKAIMN